MITEQFKQQLLQIIKDAGEFIKAEKGKVVEKQVDTKSHNSFVTYVDKQAERMLVDGLKALIPGSGFIAEEDTAGDTGSTWRWIIDPLDGTTNFIHNIFPVSVSVALQFEGKTVAGVVYEIGNDELFSAFVGEASMLNGIPIKVTETQLLSDSLIATGFPYYDYERLENYLQVLSHFMRSTRGVRRLGSAATDLAYVACGRFDVFFEYSLSPWDVAAGAFLVQQAGGNVCDFGGEANYLFGKEIIAANSFLIEEVTHLIKAKMRL